MTAFDEALVAWWVIVFFVSFVVLIFTEAKKMKEQNKRLKDVDRIAARHRKMPGGGDD